MNRFLIGIYAVVAMGLMLLSNCSSNSCSKVVCKVGEECYNGSCYCVNGYYGTNCDSLAYTKFVGGYNASASCYTSGGGVFYPYINLYTSDPSKLTIDNFLGQFQITAYLRSTADKRGNYIYIPEQQLGFTTTDYVQGEGNYNPATRMITFTINYRAFGQDNSCQQFWSKQ